jgi:hypothetical protein
MLRMPTVTLLAGLILSLASPAGVSAQGRGGGPHHSYDAATVETLAGTVVEVRQVSGQHGWEGVHLVLKTGSETIEVHLGPAWFLENQAQQIGAGDEVAVTGSRVEIDGSAAILAAEIAKGDEVLVLRDENGFPVWSAWRRRG